MQLRPAKTLEQPRICVPRNANVASPARTQSYAAAIPTQVRTSAGADPNAVTVTGPGGSSMTLGRRLLREIPSDDL